MNGYGAVPGAIKGGSTAKTAFLIAGKKRMIQQRAKTRKHGDDALRLSTENKKGIGSMNLTNAKYLEEIDGSELSQENKAFLKHVVGSLLRKKYPEKTSLEHYPIAPPVVSQEELNLLYVDMNKHGRCSITLDGFEHHYFMAEEAPFGLKLTLEPWTLDSIKLFENKGMGSNGIQAGAFYHACKEGHQNPAVYRHFAEDSDGRYFVDKSTSDWRGINLYLNDPTHRLENHACKVGREGNHTIINVSPRMYVYEYWQGCPTIRKPDGTSAIR